VSREDKNTWNAPNFGDFRSEGEIRVGFAFKMDFAGIRAPAVSYSCTTVKSGIRRKSLRLAVPTL
jgi:hypothetical protein